MGAARARGELTRSRLFLSLSLLRHLSFEAAQEHSVPAQSTFKPAGLGCRWPSRLSSIVDAQRGRQTSQALNEDRGTLPLALTGLTCPSSAHLTLYTCANRLLFPWSWLLILSCTPPGDLSGSRSRTS